MAFPPAQPNMWDAMGVEKSWEKDRANAQVNRARQDASDAQTDALRLIAQKEQLHAREKAQMQSQIQSNAEMRENVLRLNARAWEMVLRERLAELDAYQAKESKRPVRSPAEMEKIIKTMFQSARIKLYDSGVITKKAWNNIENIGNMPIGAIPSESKEMLNQDRVDLKARYDEHMALLNKILEGSQTDLRRITQADADKVQAHLRKAQPPKEPDPRLFEGVRLPWDKAPADEISPK